MLRKTKHLVAVLLVAGFAAQPALAQSFNQDDMDFAFGHSAVSAGVSNIALLSSGAMLETEGEFGPWGAVAGAGVMAVMQAMP